MILRMEKKKKVWYRIFLRKPFLRFEVTRSRNIWREFTSSVAHSLGGRAMTNNNFLICKHTKLLSTIIKKVRCCWETKNQKQIRRKTEPESNVQVNFHTRDTYPFSPPLFCHSQSTMSCACICLTRYPPRHHKFGTSSSTSWSEDFAKLGFSVFSESLQSCRMWELERETSKVSFGSNL